jgi:tRNA 2-(methylsulfanyl)-N6-isopentenyladenosine37 hydroxylase
MIEQILEFIGCRTPEVWLKAAFKQLPVMLVDHAHCEKKAASTAMNLIYRYPEKPELIQQLSRLVREEMRHFEQVLALIAQRKEVFYTLTPPTYAASLYKKIRTYEPVRLVDTLIVCALIEARSCERFAALASYLSGDLKQFYQGLVNAEARHFMLYLDFAKQYAKGSIDDRIAFFVSYETSLIQAAEGVFRLHSGVPIAVAA